MAEVKPFSQGKLICGIIFKEELYLKKAEEWLRKIYGLVDCESPCFDFNFTDYYQKEIGEGLKRKFLSFRDLISPEKLSRIKLRTNRIEQKIRREFGSDSRVVNLDPGYLTSSALIMATAKDFSHRVPLMHGIYAHLEFLFSRSGIKVLEWTYPDMRNEECQKFFIQVRKIYLSQLRSAEKK